MDQRDSSSIDSIWRLLTLCARAEGHPTFYEQLAYQVEQFTNWGELPFQAELHGMGPLLWYHFRQAGISIPLETERTLRGMYLRERALNQVHAQTLLEVLNLLEKVGIQPLVLKGLALAYKYYPEPALRPVSDIDLLLKKEDVLPSLHALEKAGYRVNFPDPVLRVLPNELKADSPLHNGISTPVELHHYDPKHRLLNDLMQDDELKGFNEPPQKLTINGCTVYTPSPMDTLHYLTRHMVRHLFLAHPEKPLPIKWSADILGLVEQHAKQIDWTDIQQNNLSFLNRLSLLYSLTPLPAKYATIIPIRKIDPPVGINQYPAGWPQQAFPEWKRVGFWRFVWQSFQSPSAWWLQLYYGIDENSVSWYGNVVYRFRVLRLLFWAIVRRKLIKHN